MLELPNSFHVSPAAQSWQIPEVSWIPIYFPNLTHLMIPSNAVYETVCWEIVGPKLEVLTLNDAGDPDVDNWVGNLHFLGLTRVQLYYELRILPVTPHFRADMLKSGIGCTYCSAAHS